MLEQKLAALKPFGQLLANGLLDDARTGEADQRAGFGNIQIAQHGEAGGNAAGGGIGEHADVRQRASSRRISAAEILAICIRLMAPSCMRAPPERKR